MRSVSDLARIPQDVERPGPWPLSACRAALQRKCLLGCLFLVTIFIAGCAWVPNKSYDDLSNSKPAAIDDDLGNSAPAAIGPLFGFLATAAADEAGIVQDPSTGANVWVIAGRTYHAASRRLCRHFFVTSPQGYEGVTEGLACWDERGGWTMSKFLINRDELGAPRLNYP